MLYRDHCSNGAVLESTGDQKLQLHSLIIIMSWRHCSGSTQDNTVVASSSLSNFIHYSLWLPSTLSCELPFTLLALLPWLVSVIGFPFLLILTDIQHNTYNIIWMLLMKFQRWNCITWPKIYAVLGWLFRFNESAAVGHCMLCINDPVLQFCMQSFRLFIKEKVWNIWKIPIFDKNSSSD